MDTTIQQQVFNTDMIFERTFLEAKTFYMYRYQQPPSISWVDRVDNEKIFQYLKTAYEPAIKEIYQYSEFNRQKKRPEFSRRIVLLDNCCMVEMTHSWCAVLYKHEDQAFSEKLLKAFGRFKKREKKSQ